jgi:hypothetical protein
MNAIAIFQGLEGLFVGVYPTVGRRTLGKEDLTAALFGRRGVFDIRWRAQRAQRLEHRIQSHRLRAGPSHTFFIGDLQLPDVEFPSVENFDLLIASEIVVLHDLLGLFESRGRVEQRFFYVDHMISVDGG